MLVMVKLATIFRRKKAIVILLLLMAVAIGPYAISRARSPARRIRVVGDAPTVATEPSSRIKILIYNIAHGRGPIDDNWEEGGDAKRDRIRKIAERIKRVDPDIVVLNEVDFHSTWSGDQNQAEAIARAAEFPNWAEQRNLDFRFIYGSWKFGNAVLSKYPIVDTQLVDFPAQLRLESWLAGHKRGVVCTLQISQSHQVRVLAVHLEYRDEDVRVASAQVIADLAESSDVPLIAAGDFNSTPTGFPNSLKTGGGENAMDLLIDIGHFQHEPRAAPTPLDFTFSTNEPTEVIDWILIPSEWTFAEYAVIDWNLSDHRPVMAVVKMPD